MMDRERTYMLTVMAIAVVLATVLFKYSTGSFLSISEEADREVQRYTINFRRNDLSIPSLKASCKDIDALYDSLVANTDFAASPCLQEIGQSLMTKPKDSVVLMVFKEFLRHAIYATMEENDGRVLRRVENDSTKGCGGTAELVFEKDSNGEGLITDLRNLDNYMKCICP
jgi:hypothetical protein